MTVSSINKRSIDQASIAAPATKTAPDAAQDFVNALQQAGTLFTSAQSVSAETALKAHFDRTADAPQQAKAPEKADRPETKSVRNDRSRDDKSSSRDDKVSAKDDRDDQAPAKADAADGAPKKVDAKGDKAKDDAADDQDAPAAQQVTEETVAVVDPQMVVSQVQAPQQQIQDVVVEDAAATLTAANAATNGTPAEADAGADETDQTAQAGADQTEAGDDFDATDALTDAATQAARRAGQHGGKDAKDDQAQAQSDDLAQRLDDTGAQLKVQVQVATADQTATVEAAPVADLLSAQELAASAQTAPTQTSQASTQTAGIANAPQPLSAAEVAAQQDKLAKTMDPALLAQLETSAQIDEPTGTSQNTQPVAGLGVAGGTTAAQKASAAQTAQGPRFQLPQQQEVMDQVSVQIMKQTKAGTDTIKVQLKPVELGAIEIKLDVGKDGRVSAVVTADNQNTLDMLQKDSSSLHKALEDAGLKPDADSMTFNLRQNQQQQQQAQQNGNGTTGNRRARLSAAEAADAAAGVAAAAAQARWSANRSGVDIKV